MKSMACCQSCHRHVRASESACPFCRGTVQTCGGPWALERSKWLGATLGASLVMTAAVLSGCPTPAYGVPAPPGGYPSPSAQPSTPSESPSTAP